jgi:hypothetical protein
MSSNVLAEAVAVFVVVASVIGASLVFQQHFQPNTVAFNVDAVSAGDQVLVTIKNTGSTLIDHVNITIPGSGTFEARNFTIAPGRSKSILFTCYAGPADKIIVRAGSSDSEASAAVFPSAQAQVSTPTTSTTSTTSSTTTSSSTSTPSPTTSTTTSSSTTTSPAPSKTIVFYDTFDSGLNGWTLWAEPEEAKQGYSIELDSHGRPSPSLHVIGQSFQNAKAGAAKTVPFPSNLEGEMLLEFNFNVQAKKRAGSFPGNLWLRISLDNVLAVDLQVYDAHSADSGWKDAKISFTVARPPQTITTIFYMIQEENSMQEFWLDNIKMTG